MSSLSKRPLICANSLKIQERVYLRACRSSNPRAPRNKKWARLPARFVDSPVTLPFDFALRAVTGDLGFLGFPRRLGGSIFVLWVSSASSASSAVRGWSFLACLAVQFSFLRFLCVLCVLCGSPFVFIRVHLRRVPRDEDGGMKSLQFAVGRGQSAVGSSQWAVCIRCQLSTANWRLTADGCQLPTYPSRFPIHDSPITVR